MKRNRLIWPLSGKAGLWEASGRSRFPASLPARLGYWLGEAYWGQALAAKAVDLFTPYISYQLSLFRLQSTVFAENYKSMRVLENCGFNRECVLRAYISKNGFTTDAVLYAKVACDFLSKASGESI